MTSGAGLPLAPALELTRTAWFNLRRIHDYSPTGMLAASREERDGVRAFLGGYGVDPVLGHLGDPLVKLKAHLARLDAGTPSRFSDGTYPVVYMGDAEATCLAEVAHHLARALAETGAEKGRAHYFLLARFRLRGKVLDVRRGFPRLHRKEDWTPAQAFGARAWAQEALGITVPFRPPGQGGGRRGVPGHPGQRWRPGQNRRHALGRPGAGPELRGCLAHKPVITVAQPGWAPRM